MVNPYPRRFDVFLVSLEPTRGSEIQKTRPCLIVSPDEANRALRTTIVAPMTTGGQPYPSRVACTFEGRPGHVVLDQLRTVDRQRLIKHLGRIDEAVQTEVLARLREWFAP